MKRCRTSKQTKIQNDHQKSNSKFMRKHEKTNKNRIKLLKDVCQKYKLDTADSNLSTKVFKRSFPRGKTVERKDMMKK